MVGGSGLPLVEQRARMQAACAVCWWGDQRQPTKLQAAERMPKEAELKTRIRTDPTKRQRRRQATLSAPIYPVP